MKPWNRIIQTRQQKQLEISKRRYLVQQGKRLMTKDFFIPIRPTLLEIRRDKLEKIKKNIDNDK